MTKSVIKREKKMFKESLSNLKALKTKLNFHIFFWHYQQITGYETILALIIQFLAIDSNKNKTDGHTNKQTIII